MTKPSLLNWIFLLLLGLIWGASFVGTKFALDSFSPLMVAGCRLLVGAIILTSIALLSKQSFPSPANRDGRKLWLFIFGMGLFTNALPFSMLSWAQTHVDSSFAGITMAVVPLLILPLAHFLVPNSKMSLTKIIGFAIGFVGTVILIGPGGILTSTGASWEPLARLACITSACCYAIGSILTRLAPPCPTIVYSALGLSVGAMLTLPLGIVTTGLPDMLSLKALIGILYLGLFPTAAATMMLVYVIRTAGPAFLSLVNYQVPVWATLLGVLILGEALPGQFAAALALILIGLAISEQRFKRKT